MSRETRRFLLALLISIALVYAVLQPRHVPFMWTWLISPHLPLWLDRPLAVLAGFSLAWVIATGFELFVWRRMYGQSLAGVPRQRKLLTDLFNVTLYVAAAGFIAIEIFHLEPTGVFATSSVIAIILGFALQQLLTDIFAGVALNMERPFKAGEWITIDGIQGMVLETNWRSTHLRTRSMDLLVVPNAVIGRAKLFNHSRPQARHLGFVDVTLQYGVDEAAVQTALKDAALTIEGILSDPAPIIAVHELNAGVMVWRIYFFTDDFSRVVIMKAQLLYAAYAALRAGDLAAHLPRNEAFLHLDPPVVSQRD
ncbi:mechanosensitive ion channel family protein [Ferrovibrio terrae]|uniref:Small-conductance mechanosensitive channel n=1 Tax=Ferrovibrio terrae TaxID=2594003 RepID=A0A516GXF4_9PROT|nr:mechanosensitive ion channel family protein [Ferrovibrio terrae]QDO96196.1 mechanosensitive ion channel family protein [Ferrovibrio terrae]